MRAKSGRIEIKTPAQIVKMRRAGLIVAQIHEALREATVPGVTTEELDKVSADVIARNNAHSNFLGYGGFPATVCISVNDQVVHGIPGKQILEKGDLVSFDCGAYILDEHGKQWHGDAAFSMIVGGDAYGHPDDLALIATTQAALWNAIAALGQGDHIGVVGDAVEAVVAQDAISNGWAAGIVEEFVGHGIGTSMHQAPDVLNYSVRGKSRKLKTGMVLAVEPILVRGSGLVRELSDGWTVVTQDKTNAAHCEHTVAILPGGVWVLTAFDGGRDGLAAFGMSPRAVAQRG
ncbi:MAG: type I methionyl aminopeptidase [Actinomycetaceae bacterium]|nr:type I methionyl aminopeptidase [Actinomycetaceae bacterium]